MLPVVRLDGTAWFVDLRLRQFRETMNPHNYVDFDTVKGTRFCQQAGVVTCLRCGTSVVVSGSPLDEGVCCVRCGWAVDNGR
ncbi:MAG: hypothetical protein JXQ73_28685 [Phycisphaerae bacterium]|nr:hypothetical protein [Phycisphaerae bacterium]